MRDGMMNMREIVVAGNRYDRQWSETLASAGICTYILLLEVGA
jgi:hypothetical protein